MWEHHFKLRNGQWMSIIALFGFLDAALVFDKARMAAPARNHCESTRGSVGAQNDWICGGKALGTAG
jgi:hypothetical protein